MNVKVRAARHERGGPVDGYATIRRADRFEQAHKSARNQPLKVNAVRRNHFQSPRSRPEMITG